MRGERFERELHMVITDIAHQLMRRQLIPVRLVGPIIRETMELAILVRRSHRALRNPRSDRARITYGYLMLWVADQQQSSPQTADAEQSASPRMPPAEIEALLRSARIDGQPAWTFPDEKEVDAMRREEEHHHSEERINLRTRYGDWPRGGTDRRP